MGDYHVHLHPHHPLRPGDPSPGDFSSDLIEGFVERALARGMLEVCFTEHLYRLRQSAPVLGEFWRDERAEVAGPTEDFVTAERDIDLDAYVEAVLAARDRGLPVKLGLEVDYFPETIDAVLELLDPYPWDMLLGSVHWIGGFAADVDEVAFEFERRGVQRVYEEYFALECQLASSGVVDVLAHIDVVKNHGHRPAGEPFDLYETVAAAAAGSDTAVEISSAGPFEPCSELYPAPALLDELRSAGVPITLASDAHRPDEVARAFDRVVAAARHAGYDRHLAFSSRKRFERALPSPAGA